MELLQKRGRLMSFFVTYWPQLVIILALLVVIGIFVRRMPSEVSEAKVEAVKKEKTKKKVERAAKNTKVSGGLTKVTEFFSVSFARVKNGPTPCVTELRRRRSVKRPTPWPICLKMKRFF